MFAENNISKALIGTEGCESYIAKSVVLRHRLEVIKSSNAICMSSVSLISQIKSRPYVNIGLKNNSCGNFRLAMLTHLCDFLKLPKSIRMASNELSPFVVQPPQIPNSNLFKNLLHSCKPVVTKSRIYTCNDEKFFQSAIKKLKEGMIDVPTSSWRAKVLVTTNERHKSTIADCSQN